MSITNPEVMNVTAREAAGINYEGKPLGEKVMEHVYRTEEKGAFDFKDVPDMEYDPEESGRYEDTIFTIFYGENEYTLITGSQTDHLRDREGKIKEYCYFPTTDYISKNGEKFLPPEVAEALIAVDTTGKFNLNPGVSAERVGKLLEEAKVLFDEIQEEKEIVAGRRRKVSPTEQVAAFVRARVVEK